MPIELLGKILRFLIAGGFSTVFMFATLFVLREVLGLWYIAASAIAFVLATCVSFIIQKFWSFGNLSLRKVKKQSYLFVSLALFNFVANILLMYIIVEYFDIWYFTAQVGVTGCIATWNFLWYHFIIFQKETENEVNTKHNFVT